MDIAPLIVILLGSVAAGFASRGLDRPERRQAMLAFGVHIVGAFAHWAVHVFFYGYGDMFEYRRFGIDLAKLLDADFARFAPELGRLALHLDTNLPFVVFGDGTSSGTMCALAGLLVFVAGPSMLSMCLVVSCLSWFGQLCLYRIARAELDPDERPVARVAFLFVPSVVFWSAGFQKEAFVVAFLGVLCASTHAVLQRRRLLHFIGILVGGVGIAMLKPFTLFAYVIAVAAFLYAKRSWQHAGRVRVRPAFVLLAAVVAIGGVLAMGRLFPTFGVDRVAETMARQQDAWHDIEGGSNIEAGSGEEDSLSSQIEFVPLAVVNVLFRPALFDVRNGVMFVGALENTLLVLGVFSLFRPRFRVRVLNALARTPLLAFCAAFTVVFGLGVGLATANLGSLSRYRMPMMPFYVAVVLILRRRVREPVVQGAVWRARPRPPPAKGLRQASPEVGAP
jgi:hypothetical protein